MAVSRKAQSQKKYSNDGTCPKCHSQLVQRHGPYGDGIFYSCPGYPQCKHSQTYLNREDYQARSAGVKATTVETPASVIAQTSSSTTSSYERHIARSASAEREPGDDSDVIAESHELDAEEFFSV